MERRDSAIKKILSDRFTFFLEVMVIFIALIMVLLIPRMFIEQINATNAIPFTMIFYFLRAALSFMIIPLGIFLFELISETQKKEIIIEHNISPAMGHVKLFSISEENFKYQLLYGIILLFVFFIPMDFLGYLLISGALEFQASSLTSNELGTYFSQPYLVFLISVLVIHISVAFYEENLSRGYLAKRGSEYFNKVSAIVMSSMYFGMMHFAFILDPNNQGFNIIVPIFFFFQAFLVGFVLSLFLIKKKWILPGILAHAANNIISAHTIWAFTQGTDFATISLYLYLPLLIGSVFIFVWQFSKIKEGIKTGMDEIKTYFKEDDKIGESKTDVCFRILIDIGMGFILFLLGLFVFGL